MIAEQLAIAPMDKLGEIHRKQGVTPYSDMHIALLNIQFDLAYEEIYGYLPDGS